MPFFVGNVAFKMSTHLHSRVFCIPWVMRRSRVMCLKKRDYGSSVPIRYIPKRPSQSKQSDTSQPVKSKEEINYPRHSEVSSPKAHFVKHVQRSVRHEKPQNWNDALCNLFCDGVQDFYHREEPVSDKDVEEFSIHESRGCSELDLKCTQGSQEFISQSHTMSSFTSVRSSPKSSSNNNLSETSSPLKSLKENKHPRHLDASVSETNYVSCVQQRILYDETTQQISNSLFDDVEQEFELMGEPEENFEDFCMHQLRSCEEDLLQADKCAQDAEKLATKLLARRALTAVELRKKLLGKRFSPDIVDAVIDKFHNRGLINDRLYAEAFSQSRWSSSSWGPRRIKQALHKKGVSKVDADKAVELVFEKGGCDEDWKESTNGFSKQTMDQLYVQASKQWLRGRDVSKETRKSRIIRWLQYRGFDWDVISSILKKLDHIDSSS